MIEAFMARVGRDWLLADGAIGTTLFDMGLTVGDAPEFWNELFPARIRALQQQFVDAGADIILTNTFGANPCRLARYGAQGRARELSRIGAGIARDVAEAAGRPVLVAGSVGPTGEPLAELTEAEAEGMFAEQMAGLQEGGADLVWIETMSAIGEMRAAAAAAARLGMPYSVTASFHLAGNTMTGLTPAAMGRQTAAFTPRPQAIGCNCGVGPPDLVCSVLSMTEAVPNAIVVAKANCGMPQIGAQGAAHSSTPAAMARYARLARDAGARIVGGCCGTTAAHLAAMRRALDGYLPGARPGRDELIEILGPLAGSARERRF
jgi:methionine synthase I (cobalamin-dependent)